MVIIVMVLLLKDEKSARRLLVGLDSRHQSLAEILSLFVRQSDLRMQLTLSALVPKLQLPRKLCSSWKSSQWIAQSLVANS